MPISRNNKARYPSNWHDIRTSILNRAENKCEICDVVNYSIGYRNEEKAFIMCDPCLNTQGKKFIKIILTTAHVYDENPENCENWNLLALCQMCHNRLDGKRRAVRAAETRKNNLNRKNVL